MAVDVNIIVRASTQQAQRAMQSLSRSMVGLNARADALRTSFLGIDRVWTLLAVGSGAALITTFTKMAIEVQNNTFRIGVFTKDMNLAKQEVDGMLALARKAPFSFEAMGRAAARMRAGGVDDLSSTMQTLADAIAATGGSDDLLERAAVAIQQMSGKGVISMEELRQQLGEALPMAMSAMAEGMGLSMGELVDRISKGKVEFEGAFKAMIEILDRDFGGAAELMSRTFGGQLGRIQTEIQALAQSVLVNSGGLDFMGQVLFDLNERAEAFSSNLKISLEDLIEFITPFAFKLVEIAEHLWEIMQVVGALGAAVGAAIALIPPEAVSAGLIGYFFFGKKGFAVVSVFTTLLPSLVKGFIDVISTMGQQAEAYLGQFGQAALGFGIIGFFIFGFKGMLIGGLIGAVVEALRTFQTQVTDVIATTIVGFSELGRIIGEIFDYVRSFGTDEIVWVSDQTVNNAKQMREELTASIDALIGPGNGDTKSQVDQFFAEYLGKTKQFQADVAALMGNFGSPNPPEGGGGGVSKLDPEAYARLVKEVNKMATSAELLRLENAFDDVGIAGVQASQRIQGALDGIEVKILDIQDKVKDGVLTPAQGEELTQKLIAQRQVFEEQGELYIERMKFLASDWGKLVQNIGSAMENSFANAFEQIANGSANAKDILLSFYADITRAVSQYLARQVMVGMFGNMFAGGGAGGLFGAGLSLFGGGGGGAAAAPAAAGGANFIPAGFQHGGSFIVGGSGGPDSQMVAFRASPDERVTITRPDQESGGGMNITIHAVDARGVQDLFMRQGSTLVRTLERNQRLNQR